MVDLPDTHLTTYFPTVTPSKIHLNASLPLCGAHALERVREMKSQKTQKGGLFDSVDEKGVLVKSVEQGWGFRSYSKHWGGKGTYDTTQCSYTVCKSNATFRPNITKCAHFSLWHFIQYFISLHTDKILTWYFCKFRRQGWVFNS